MLLTRPPSRMRLRPNRLLDVRWVYVGPNIVYAWRFLWLLIQLDFHEFPASEKTEKYGQANYDRGEGESSKD